jgi:hypothetical protein
MGKLFKSYLGGGIIYRCSVCDIDLCLHDELVSKSFQGRHGRAYLYSACVNVIRGESEDRVLTTGLHTVCDIYCIQCQTNVGWYYISAYETSQKYKEGKYIVEKEKIRKVDMNKIGQANQQEQDQSAQMSP